VRRMGWFLLGAAATAGVVAATAPRLRERLRGDDHDDLPEAVGLDDSLLDDAEEETAEVDPLVPVPHTDERADELRERIEDSRGRLRQKARAGAGDAQPEPETAANEVADEDDQPPAAG